MLTLIASSLVLSQGLIPNGSFEQLTNGRPTGWQPQTWSGRANVSIAGDAHSGSNCLVVESSAGGDAGMQIQIPVRPFSKYRLTAWIKTENIQPIDGQGALINLHSRSEHTQPITGTSPWTKAEMTIDTDASDALAINCMIGYFGTAKGKAYFDDVNLELLETRDLKPTALIDATKTYDPISKYIYSQFIEHLGRCIYGGIWAEMLDDRKFYYNVGDRRSPWHTSAGSTVTMDKTAPFVGDHTPVVNGSLSQGGLWLQKGRDYVGHAWIKSGGPVSLSIQGPTVQLKTGSDWTRTDFKFKATSDTKTGQLTFSGTKPYSIGAVSLMPADNIEGMRKDTLALLKQLNAPLYRWPGGNFASGYDWRDGIGDPDRRPPRKNPAWQGIEHNDFGTHEFLRFCELINTEPLIVVNTGFGDANTAAEWMKYVKGAPNSEQGRKRAANGHVQPWKVTWWGIGNEMFGPWQLGHMALDQYEIKHNIFFDRMTKVDPTIKTIASGDLGFGEWSKGMLTNCGDQMTLLSEHFYCQEQVGVMAHAAQIPNAIRAKVEAHRRYRDTIPGLKQKNIKIAMDEWNFWYGPHVFGELGTRYFMKDALGIAEGLHEYYRSTDIVGMAQYAQTVNVIGAIKTTPTDAAFETTGLILKMYRDHFGELPTAIGGAPQPLDVMAARTADKKWLTIGIVNPTSESVTLPLSWKGVSVADAGDAWEVAHPDPMVFNNPGDAPKVVINHRSVTGLGQGATVKPYSATVIRVRITG